MAAGETGIVDRVVTWMTIGILLLAMTLALGERGIVRTRFRDWNAARIDRRNVDSVLRAVTTRGVPENAMGPGGGRLLLEVADYQCPYCRTMQSRLLRLRNVRVGQLHFPLASHPQARSAALAAICAADQGQGEAMHQLLYQRDEWYDAPEWGQMAWKAGVSDSSKFRACMGGSWAAQRLMMDSVLASRLGVTATPTFAARGGKHTGIMTEAELERLLQ